MLPLDCAARENWRVDEGGKDVRLLSISHTTFVAQITVLCIVIISHSLWHSSNESERLTLNFHVDNAVVCRITESLACLR